MALAKIDLTRKWIFQDYIISTTKRVGTYCSLSTMEPNPFFSRILISIAQFTYSVDSIKRTVHLAFHGLFSLLKILFTNSKQYF